MMEGFGTMSGALLAVVCILLLAYWFSHFLGKRWGTGSPAGTHIKILERVQIGPDRWLLLVKLHEHTYFLGVSDKGIQLLAEPDGTFEEVMQDNRNTGFQEILKALGTNRRGDRHD